MNLPDFRLELGFTSSWSKANLPLARMSWDKPSVFSAADWVLYSELPPPKSGTNNLVYRLHLKQRTHMIHMNEMSHVASFFKKIHTVLHSCFSKRCLSKIFLLVGLFPVDFNEQLKLLIELPEVVRIYVEKWQHAGSKEWY